MHKNSFRAVVATLLVAVSLSAGAASAQASGYYLSRAEAVSNTRQWLHENVGYRWTAAACRPQGGSYADGDRYTWHRWVCGWLAGTGSRWRTSCKGQYRVRGQSDGTVLFMSLWKQGPECD